MSQDIWMHRKNAEKEGNKYKTSSTSQFSVLSDSFSPPLLQGCWGQVLLCQVSPRGSAMVSDDVVRRPAGNARSLFNMKHSFVEVPCAAGLVTSSRRASWTGSSTRSK
eukprot:424051-Hanusia_phi.AAC.2